VATRYRIGFVAEAPLHMADTPRDCRTTSPGSSTECSSRSKKAFADPAVQPLRRHSYGRLHRILSGCYFEQRQWRRLPPAFREERGMGLAERWVLFAYRLRKMAAG
jgi:hypothetical protein